MFVDFRSARGKPPIIALFRRFPQAGKAASRALAACNLRRQTRAAPHRSDQQK
tara:strand:+ start:154 stop:312 length:159 start_codon:yes stop_codon:yes gene_type:complete